MRFIFLISYKYPSARPVYIYMESMARAFNTVLGRNFTFVIAGSIPQTFKDMNILSINSPESFRSVFYFFYLPFFIFKKKYNNKNSIFFSNDPYLSSILIFWRKIFKFKYIIYSDWHQLFEDWRDKYVAVNSDYLVSTTKKIKNAIIQKTKIPESKIIVSYGGVDVSIFKHNPEPIKDLRRRLGLPEDGILVGYVGFYKTMGMGKGVDTMIKALPFIKNENTSPVRDREGPQRVSSSNGIKMVFVGAIDNKEIKEYRKIAENFGVADRTIFLLAVKAKEVPAFEQAMDILVIPYPDQPHFREYGFPMKVYEYMFSKKPIIYSNLPIIDEMLSDCAISIIPDNPKDLAQKITYLSEEQSVGKKLAEKAFEKVLGCTWEKRAENIVKFVKIA